MNRKKLINEILDLSGDEFETKEDFIQLAKESNWELTKTLNHIKNYIS
jgi:hypothetical protein